MSRTDDILTEPLTRATPSQDPRSAVYRVVGATELAYLQMNGNYGFSPNQSGKYFTRTLAGAIAFAAAPMNAGRRITETSLPQSVLNQGFLMIDPGVNGAGLSVHFPDALLVTVYAAMTPPVVR